MLRRAGRWEELLALWEGDVGGKGSWRVRALIETAKVYQRRLGRPDRATASLSEATALIEWLHLRGDPLAGLLDEQVRTRLEKLARSASRSVGLRAR
jgi:hypothetical protein